MNVRTAFFVSLWALFSGSLMAAPSAPVPALQAEVDRAVAMYSAGQWPQAQVAFEKLAWRQVPAAAYNLGVMHLRGEARGSSPSKARRFLEQAASGGFVTAQLNLARALEAGDLGTKDLRRAHDWYARAAAAGVVEAQVAMGTAHYLGRGRPLDPAAAAHWFREAAKAGDEGAMYLLASMYEQGDGVPQDWRLARYWYNAAAAAGDVAAPLKVQELDARDELARAVQPPPR